MLEPGKIYRIINLAFGGKPFVRLVNCSFFRCVKRSIDNGDIVMFVTATPVNKLLNDKNPRKEGVIGLKLLYKDEAGWIWIRPEEGECEQYFEEIKPPELPVWAIEGRTLDALVNLNSNERQTNNK